ncbi:MAG: heme-binding protein [Gammaproteobacteria bacterium]|nr:heme-binding protein [Gammaproteobacteria bacterium]
MTSVTNRNVTTKTACAIAQAAVDHAGNLGIAINVSVVDSSATEIAFLRMNNAFLPSMGIAKDKAYTAAGFGFPTMGWKDILDGNQQLQAGMVERPRVVTFGGGVPIFEGDILVGAVGVSGGSEEEDIACAQAGIDTVFG